MNQELLNAITDLPAFRREARRLARARWNAIPVEISGHASRTPHMAGEDAYWTTPSGNTIISHPGSYNWPKVYHCTTRHVQVGRKWAVRWLWRHLEIPADLQGDVAADWLEDRGQCKWADLLRERVTVQ